MNEPNRASLTLAIKALPTRGLLAKSRSAVLEAAKRSGIFAAVVDGVLVLTPLAAVGGDVWWL
jgi:hypothetical protein